ncbi:MAG TPA: NrfD/PsrC family molybdoenzyme membrane anchor subunit [Methylomirabilota bacterium]|nr:NrfD/PsrC family molybdoenzyme membrane anchor subunit [Methylomirabilota bacterium]
MRVFTDPFDVLLQDFQEPARPQREWVDGRGLLLITGHFLSSVGSGGWVFSTMISFVPGEVTSFVLVALSGLAHLLFLGRPARFWRMIRVQTSWVSRGFVGLTLFTLAAAVYLLLTVPAGRVGPLANVAWWVSIAGAALIMLYKGNVYAVCRAIPFWNSSLLPILYVAYALRGGTALLLVFLPWAGSDLRYGLLEILELWIGLSAGVCILFYLTIMASSSVGARRSVEDLLRGRVATAFYGGVVALGFVVPVALGIWNTITPLSFWLLAVIGAASLAGDFYVKYAIAKAGRYLPHVHPAR